MIKFEECYEKIISRWEASTNMRIYLTEKKKNLSVKFDESGDDPDTSKSDAEVVKIIEKIVEKAELIVKLSMPKSWDIDSSKEVLVSEVEPHDDDMGINLNPTESVQAEINFMERLKSFSSKQ